MTTRVAMTRRQTLAAAGTTIAALGSLILTACASTSGQTQPTTSLVPAPMPSQSSTVASVSRATAPSSAPAASVGKLAGALSVGLKGGTPDQLKAIDATIAKFQQTYPEVKVTTVNFGTLNKNWLEAFTTQQAAGTLSDTFGIIEYNQGLIWAYQGVLQPVDAFIASDKAFQLADYSARAVDTYRLGGKLWGIPQAPNPVLIYYNRSHLDTVQQQPPTNDWTTDTFVLDAQHATTGIGGPNTVWGYAYNRRWSLFLGWLAAFGASMTSADRTQFTMNTSAALDALQFDVDLIYKERTGPPPDSAVGSAVGLIATSPAQFATGNVAYTLDGIASAPSYTQKIGSKFTWDVLPLPKGPKGHGSTLSADGWWIKKDTKLPEASWAMVKAMVGEDNERAQMTAALVYPSLKKLVPEYFQLTNVKNQDAVTLTVEQLGIPFPVTPSLTKWTTDLLAPALNDMWNNKKTPKEAMDGIAPQVNALLAADAKASKL